VIYVLLFAIGMLSGWVISLISFKAGAKASVEAVTVLTVTPPEFDETEMDAEEGAYNWDSYDEHMAYLENFGLQGQEEEQEEPKDEDFEELPN